MAPSKKLEISVVALGYGCDGWEVTPEECEAIAAVFSRAAIGIRAKEYGVVQCRIAGEILAQVAIDHSDIPFDGESMV
jgi:hypothetical protein